MFFTKRWPKSENHYYSSENISFDIVEIPINIHLVPLSYLSMSQQ
jgi:hypothetical protein